MQLDRCVKKMFIGYLLLVCSVSQLQFKIWCPSSYTVCRYPAYIQLLHSMIWIYKRTGDIQSTQQSCLIKNLFVSLQKTRQVINELCKSSDATILTDCSCLVKQWLWNTSTTRHVFNGCRQVQRRQHTIHSTQPYRLSDASTLHTALKHTLLHLTFGFCSACLLSTDYLRLGHVPHRSPKKNLCRLLVQIFTGFPVTQPTVSKDRMHKIIKTRLNRRFIDQQFWQFRDIPHLILPVH